MADVKRITNRSTHLHENRTLSILMPHAICQQHTYPVVYCADGQSIAHLAHFITSEMQVEHVPPVVLVGVHSHGETRAEDYVPGVDPPRFAAHERFFTEEVPQWVEAVLQFTPTRLNCGVYGYSNGGALAVNLGLRHRDQYGVTIAFSVSGSPTKTASSIYQKEPRTRFYLAAGTRERLFKKNTRRIATALMKHGIEHNYVEREAGHNYEFWKYELLFALAWAFGSSTSKKHGFRNRS